jgi:ABC-type transport system involved in Fe-S cluster assembly fused permease/ATPase subunit
LKEYRIYVCGELKNICVSEFVLFNNIDAYNKTYGKENVSYKKVDAVMDDEKREWLSKL